MPYATFSETNPILNVIIMSPIYLLMPVELMLKKGGIIIMASHVLTFGMKFIIHLILRLGIEC